MPTVLTKMAAKDDDEAQPLLSVVVQKPKRSIVLEPVVFMYALGLYGLVPVGGQYVFVQIGKKYNYTQAGIGNADNGSLCSVNKSDPTYVLQQQIESEAATFSLYSSMLCSLPAIISATYIGGYTDKRGRRLGIILPVFGAFVHAFVYIPVIYFEMSIYFLLIGSFANGLSGYFTVFLSCVFAYLADCSTHETRARRIVLAELFLVVGAFTTNFGLGYMITGVGFLWSAILLSGILAVSFTYALFFVPETIVQQPNSPVDIISVLRHGLKVFQDDKSTRRPVKLLLLLLALCFFFLVLVSSSAIVGYFLIDSPLCFSSSEIGIYSGATSLVVAIGVGSGLFFFLKKMKLKHLTVVQIACVSFVAHYIILGLSKTRFLAYLAVGVGLFEFMSVPVLRSAMSKMVHPTEQGSLFSLIATVESICSFVGNFLWSFVYGRTVTFFNGFTFFCMAASGLTTFVIVTIHKSIFRDNQQHQTDRKENEDKIQ